MNNLASLQYRCIKFVGYLLNVRMLFQSLILLCGYSFSRHLPAYLEIDLDKCDANTINLFDLIQQNKKFIYSIIIINLMSEQARNQDFSWGGAKWPAGGEIFFFFFF